MISVYNNANDADNANNADNTDGYNSAIGIALLKAFSCAKKEPICIPGNLAITFLGCTSKLFYKTSSLVEQLVTIFHLVSWSISAQPIPS